MKKLVFNPLTGLLDRFPTPKEIGASTKTSYSATAPTSPAAGDRWVDTTDLREYERINGAWIEMSSGLVGPQGPEGPKGERGVEGPKGDKGERGLQGVQGDPGVTTWNGITGKPVTFPIESHYHEISDVTNLSGQLASKQPLGSYATLDSTGRVPSSLLPSFVDDVIEVDSFAGLTPSIGSEGKIYVVKGVYDSGDGTGSRAGRQFRWGGTQYVEIVASPGSTSNVPEGTNLYFTATRVLGSALTGFAAAATNATLAATDTVLDAFGKVQKQISDAVTSLTSHTTNVNNPHSVTKTQVGLGNVDNTSDLLKPISTATQTALDTKQATISAGTTAQYYRGDNSWATLDKTAVGLGSVDNTSDLLKPISTATQTALDGKQASGSYVVTTDARLSDARTPTSHNHDASNINAGTLANDRLPARLGATAHSISDWNNALENGWYQGSQAANAPDGVLDWWLGYVEVHNALWVTQTVHRFTADAPANTHIWRRSSSDNGSGSRVWNAWHKLQLSQAEQDARYQASGSYVVTTDARLSDARTPTSHTHDDRYYTETEIDTKLSGLVSSHTHDDRYYTETETTTILAPAIAGVRYNGLFIPTTGIADGKKYYYLNVPDPANYASTEYRIQWNPQGYWRADVEWRDDGDGYWRIFNTAIGNTEFPWQATWQANPGGLGYQPNPAPTILPGVISLVNVITPDNIAPVVFNGRQLPQTGVRNGKYQYFYDDGNSTSYGVYWVPEPQNDSGRWVAYESYSGDGDSYTEYWAQIGQGGIENYLSPFPYHSNGQSFGWTYPNSWSSTGVQVTRVGTYTGQYSTTLVPARLGVQGSTGTATTAARADHVHALPTLSELGAASEDHFHYFSSFRDFYDGGQIFFPARDYTIWNQPKNAFEFYYNTALPSLKVTHFENNAGPYIEFRKYVGQSGFSVNSIVGSITKNATGTAVAYNTTSDYRLKTNLEPLTAAVSRLLQIPVHRFNWLADPDGEKVDGFLAHEAQAIVPESVTGTKDAEKTEEYEVTPAVKDENGEIVTPAVMGTRTVPDYQGIDQSKLVPLLVAAVQELAARVAVLESK